MEAFLLILFAIAIFALNILFLSIDENKDVTITSTTILNQKHGKVNVMLFLNEIIGVAYIVVVKRHRCIIRDTQNTISAENQLNGLFQFANLAMTNNIINGE
jgi:hypothetical protein